MYYAVVREMAGSDVGCWASGVARGCNRSAKGSV